MNEQPSEQPSSEGRVTRRLQTNESPILPPPITPRTDQTRILAFVLIGLGVAMLVSNLGSMARSSTTGHPVAIERRGISAADISFDWGRGSLRITDGQNDTIVSGSVESQKPINSTIDSADGASNDIADITISAPRTGWFFGDEIHADGSLMLNKDLRYHRLRFELGAGSSDIDLSRLNVAEFNVDSGSGALDIQVPAQGKTTGEINSGSGALNVVLPPQTPVRIVLDKGSGGFYTNDRLQLVDGDVEDGVYETPGFDAARDHVELMVDGGSGSITIK